MLSLLCDVLTCGKSLSDGDPQIGGNSLKLNAIFIFLLGYNLLEWKIDWIEGDQVKRQRCMRY